MHFLNELSRRLQILLVLFLSVNGFAQVNKGGELKFGVDFARFQGPKGYTYLELYFAISRDQIEHQLVGKTYEGKYDIEINLFRGDSLAMTKSLSNRDEVKSLDEIRRGQSLYELATLFVQGGKYRLWIKLRDLGNQKVGWVEFDLLIKPFSTNELDISDLQLGLQVTKDSAKSKFVKNGYRIIPNPTAMYGGDWSNLYYYTEIYNLRPVTDGTDSTYTVEVVLKDNTGKVLKSLPTKTRSRKAGSLVELGEVNVGFQTSDVKEIEVKVIDNSISRSVSVGKKFFVYRPQRVSSSSTSEPGTDQSSADEFHGMLEKELNEQFDYARYLATKDEKKLFKRLDLGGKKNFMTSFWANRDYDPGTVFNEFKHEYLQRVSIANSRYHSGSNKPGWRTDQGRVFILYGEPDRTDRFPGTKNNYQIWRYDSIEGGVEFVFVDVRGFGELRLVHSTKRGEIYDAQWTTRYAR